MKKIFNIVGARPNFMKIAPIIEEMNKHNNFKSVLVHTGQHYDQKMSKVFFENLGIPKPDFDLGIGSGTHAEQTAGVMVAFEKLCEKEHPDLVLVVGDVNSTLACSVVAAKLCIPVAHVEAGLRSGDRTMPEEVNRIVTDALSDILFTTSKDADENLAKEGVAKEKIYFVGNVMIDTLLKHKEKAQHSSILKTLNLIKNGHAQPFGLITLHRPSNVDSPETLKGLLEALAEIQKRIPIIFPMHPRTRKQITLFGMEEMIKSMTNLQVIDPLGYLDFLAVVSNAKLVLTDSGGLQEETTVLGVPCFTLRENTERPITIWEGTSTLVGTDKEKIVQEVFAALETGGKQGKMPVYWDGKAAERIVAVLNTRFSQV